MTVTFGITMKKVLDIVWPHIQYSIYESNEFYPICDQYFEQDKTNNCQVWHLTLKEINYQDRNVSDYYFILDIAVSENDPYGATFTVKARCGSNCFIVHQESVHSGYPDSILSLYYHMSPTSEGFYNFMDIMIEIGKTFGIEGVAFPSFTVPWIAEHIPDGLKIKPFSEVTTAIQVPPNIGEKDIRKFEKPIKAILDPETDKSENKFTSDDPWTQDYLNELVTDFNYLIDYLPTIENPALREGTLLYFPRYTIYTDNKPFISVSIMRYDEQNKNDWEAGVIIHFEEQFVLFKYIDAIGEEMAEFKILAQDGDKFQKCFEASIRFLETGQLKFEP